MNKQNDLQLSPEKRKINYYEENQKIIKREKQRQSLHNIIKVELKENINDENFKFDFEEHINNNINPEILNLQNGNSISQPIDLIKQSNNNNEIFGNNILDDFLNEIENEENGKNKNYINNKEMSIADELKGSFQRNKYNVYFQTSRTQNQQFSNFWDDFHQKRDKL